MGRISSASAMVFMEILKELQNWPKGAGIDVGCI